MLAMFNYTMKYLTKIFMHALFTILLKNGTSNSHFGEPNLQSITFLMVAFSKNQWLAAYIFRQIFSIFCIQTAVLLVAYLLKEITEVARRLFQGWTFDRTKAILSTNRLKPGQKPVKNWSNLVKTYSTFTKSIKANTMYINK